MPVYINGVKYIGGYQNGNKINGYMNGKQLFDYSAKSNPNDSWKPGQVGNCHIIFDNIYNDPHLNNYPKSIDVKNVTYGKTYLSHGFTTQSTNSFINKIIANFNEVKFSMYMGMGLQHVKPSDNNIMSIFKKMVSPLTITIEPQMHIPIVYNSTLINS